MKGVEAQGPLAAGDAEADVAVAVAAAVGGGGGAGGLGELVEGVGDVESDGFGGVEEPLEVGAELEDPSVVDAHALEDAVAVEQSVVADGDGGAVGGEELAVEPDAFVGRLGGGRLRIGVSGGRGHGRAPGSARKPSV